jgi:peptidyl-dipeptidase A
MGTILHELGHAVYDIGQDPELPYLLREPAHIFTTEAVAMFFGRLSQNARWIKTMLGLSDTRTDEIEAGTRKYARISQLVFARWAMVMYRFEKQLYADPEADLNTLWWDTVERYQMLRRPDGRNEPDWAAKIHFAVAPCYYHNYLLGELLASQLQQYILGTVLKENKQTQGLTNRAEIGAFFKERVFAPGSRYTWLQMIRRATGESLTPRHFAHQFVET